MPNCYNCGAEVAVLMRSSTCSAPSCRNKIEMGAGSTANFYCPTHQQEFPRKINDLEQKVSELTREVQNKYFSTSPSQELQALRTENQRLTNSLTLKELELTELQAQIRALHSQLSERENHQPSQAKITKLERKLELVKQKLTQWTQLLTKHD